jgi:hypothetical protein
MIIMGMVKTFKCQHLNCGRLRKQRPTGASIGFMGSDESWLL